MCRSKAYRGFESLTLRQRPAAIRFAGFLLPAKDTNHSLAGVRDSLLGQNWDEVKRQVQAIRDMPGGALRTKSDIHHQAPWSTLSRVSSRGKEKLIAYLPKAQIRPMKAP